MNDISLYEKLYSLEKNFPVKICKLENEVVLLPHWHEHVEFLYFFDGEGDFNCNGNIYNISAGDFIVVNTNELHSYIIKTPLSYFYIHLYPSFFSDVNFENRILENYIHNDSYIKKCLYDMYNESNKTTIGSDMLLKSHAYRLMAYLAQNYTVTHLSPQEYDAYFAKLCRINSIIKYISLHYQEKVTTESLAKMCFLNKSYFCRFFKDATGKTITNYINEMRIEKASVFLRNTNESITTIAMNVGFDDVNYFDRVFKRIKKVSPGEYRRTKE